MWFTIRLGICRNTARVPTILVNKAKIHVIGETKQTQTRQEINVFISAIIQTTTNTSPPKR